MGQKKNPRNIREENWQQLKKEFLDSMEEVMDSCYQEKPTATSVLVRDANKRVRKFLNRDK